MANSKTFRYILLYALVSCIIYIIGTGTYITYLMINNENLLKTTKCLDIDISDGIILEKDINKWSQGYNIVKPIKGYTKLKCPTDKIVIYNIFNDTLVGYLEADDVMLNYNISIIDCNNKIKYSMTIGNFIGVIVNNEVLLVSVAIRSGDKTMYYVKYNMYNTNEFELYNNVSIAVANLKYINNLWNISIYNYTDTVDYNMLLSLANYHQYYVSGFTDDICNQYIKISYVLMFCILMLMICSCIVCVRDILYNKYC